MTTDFDDRSPIEYTQDLFLTSALLVTLGRWWCNLPDRALQELKDLSAGFKPSTGLCSMTPTNRKMLRCFDDHALADRLIALPSTMVEPYLSRAAFSGSELRRIQRATLIEVSLATALRPKNMASLRIGKHLIERGGRLHVHIPANEVKNNVELEIILPPTTERLVRFYIKKIRPLLCDDANDHLWPSSNGRPLGTGYIGGIVGDTTEAEIGVRVTGHRFRHVAGYIYLLDNPSGYEVVRLLLGHKSIKTTMTYYCSLEAREGFRRFDAFISRRRDALRRMEVERA